MPVFGSTSHEPNPAAFDWISDTPIPWVSAVHRYVVSPARPGDGRRLGALRVDQARSGLDRGQQGDAVGPFVQDVGTVEPGRRRRLDQQVRPLRVVGIVGEAELRSPAAPHRASDIPASWVGSCGAGHRTRRP